MHIFTTPVVNPLDSFTAASPPNFILEQTKQRLVLTFVTHCTVKVQSNTECLCPYLCKDLKELWPCFLLPLQLPYKVYTAYHILLKRFLVCDDNTCAIQRYHHYQVRPALLQNWAGITCNLDKTTLRETLYCPLIFNFLQISSTTDPVQIPGELILSDMVHN